MATLTKILIVGLITCLTIFSKIVSSSTFHQNIIPIEMKTQIDTLILEVIEKEKIPAHSLSIVKRDGSLLYNTGYGERDVEHHLPAGAETLFAIGSATKSFTAVLVAKTLHEMYPSLGKAVLDVPIRELAPGYQFTLGDRFRSERVTFKDILAHRVCIKEEISGLFSQAFNGTEDMVNRFRYAPEDCGFRSDFSYNNGLIGMAGHILGHIANTSYADLLSEFVTQLGMTRTTVIKMSDDHANMMQRAIPYIWKGGEFLRGNSELLKSIAPIPSGGGILSSANDMAKYMLFHLNKGKVGDVQVVPTEVMGWLTTPVSTIYSGFPRTVEDPDAIMRLSVAYGLCMYMGNYDGWERTGHGGHIPPFISSFYMYPNLGLGIFTSRSGSARLVDPEGLSNAIFHIVTGSSEKAKRALETGSNTLQYKNIDLPYVEVNRDALENSAVMKNNKNVEIYMTPEEAVGTYGSGFNGEMNVTFRTNLEGVQQLYWQYGRSVEGWLVQISPSTFMLSKWGSDLWMVYWSYGIGYGGIQLRFLDIDTLEYLELGEKLANDFKRGETIEDLPVTPWLPGSC